MIPVLLIIIAGLSGMLMAFTGQLISKGIFESSYKLKIEVGNVL